MNFTNIEKASYLEVQSYLKKSLNLTDYQMCKMYDNDTIRMSPFEFYKRKKKISNIWLRLSIIFLPIVWLLLFIGLPINFIITGRWGYNSKFNFIINWLDNLNV